MPAQQPELLNSSDKENSESTVLTLDTDAVLSDIVDTLGQKSVIAIRFPAFADGRGFSLARMLRERHGFTGTLRALGDFLPDQMHYLVRCGFDSFALPEGTNPETVESCLAVFTEAYQTACDREEPLFRRL